MRNILLLLMIFFYISCYIYIGSSKGANSISSLICDEDKKYIIMALMSFMGLFTLMYEILRKDYITLILIYLILFGIFGLLNFNEEHIEHYIYAGLVFISILLFMYRILYIYGPYIVLIISLVIQLILLYILSKFNDNILYVELGYILNFAFFYLYTHFLDLNNFSNSPNV